MDMVTDTGMAMAMVKLINKKDILLVYIRNKSQYLKISNNNL